MRLWLRQVQLTFEIALGVSHAALSATCDGSAAAHAQREADGREDGKGKNEDSHSHADCVTRQLDFRNTQIRNILPTE